MKYYATIETKDGELTWEVEVVDERSVLVNGEPQDISWLPLKSDGRDCTASMIMGSRSHEVVAEGIDQYYWSVLVGAEPYEVRVLDELAWRVSQAEAAGGGASGTVSIKSPMPGVILNIPLAVGAAVTKGQTVIILESMKMENELKSPRDGVIEAIHVEQGATVEKGQLLVTVGDGE